MSNVNSKTDREISLNAEEFIWDDSGASEANNYILPSLQRLLEMYKPNSILDLGCGNGYCAGYLHQLGFNISGCDFSESGITLAKKQFPEVHFFQQDVSSILNSDHTGRYDAVISTEVIEHLLLPRKLIENASQALRSGGVFILSTPYHGYLKNLVLALTDSFDGHWHPLRDYGHVKFFSRKTITLLFQEFGFQNICFETVGRIPVFAKSMIVSGIKP